MKLNGIAGQSSTEHNMKMSSPVRALKGILREKTVQEAEVKKKYER